MNTALYNNKGVSFVELLVAIAIIGVISTAVLNLYIRSTRTYTEQLAATEAMQNLRAGIESIARDLRMAGFKGRGGATTGFATAAKGNIIFNMDLNEDGDVLDANEVLEYKINGSNALGREASGGGGAQPVAELIDGLAFAYAYDANDDGQLDVNGSGRTIWGQIGANGNWFNLDANDDGIIDDNDDTNGNGTLNAVDTGTVADLEDIVVVQIWLLARTSRPDNDHTDTVPYTVGDTVFTGNDNFHRRLVTTKVYCRNMGG